MTYNVSGGGRKDRLCVDQRETRGAIVNLHIPFAFCQVMQVIDIIRENKNNNDNNYSTLPRPILVGRIMSA